MTETERNILHRRTVRLQGWDYTSPGAYFITICTYNRDCLFGEITNGEIKLSEFGQAATECWQGIQAHFPNVELGACSMMPNHVHGIITILGRDTACRVPVLEGFGRPAPGSIPTMVRSFKSAVTKRINEIRKSPGEPVWQSHFYDHIIRDDAEMQTINDYIEGNAARWAEDEENTVKQG